MKNKKIIAIAGILLILGVLITFKLVNTAKFLKPVIQDQSKKVQGVPEVHYHAGFVVFNEGQKIDFSDTKYMFIKPCSVDGNEAEDPQTLQMEKAHLHDGVGDVVHVENEGAKWGDLLTNIKYPIDYSQVSAFINGTEVQNIRDLPIKAYDSLVIFVGNTDLPLLSQAVSVDHIKEVESKSVECGE